MYVPGDTISIVIYNPSSASQTINDQFTQGINPLAVLAGKKCDRKIWIDDALFEKFFYNFRQYGTGLVDNSGLV